MSQFKKECIEALNQSKNKDLETLLNLTVDTDEGYGLRSNIVLDKNGTNDVIVHGFELLTVAILNDNFQAVRLLLAHQADENITPTEYEELCRIASNKNAKIVGLLHASNALNDIELTSRRTLRSEFFCTFQRKKYDWYTALYGMATLENSAKLVHGTIERLALSKFLNRLAKIDSQGEDYTFIDNKSTLLVIDYVTMNTYKYTITENLSLASLFEKHYQNTKNSRDIPLIWEEYQKFAEIRWLNKRMNSELTLYDYMGGETFCFLHLNFQQSINDHHFDFKRMRFIKPETFKRMLSKPGFLGEQIRNCFDFMSLCRKEPDSLPAIMKAVLDDEILFSRVFLGINGAIDKLPIATILEGFSEDYKNLVEEEVLFWKPIIAKDIDVVENLQSIIYQAILTNNQRLFNRVVKEIDHMIRQYRINTPLANALHEAINTVIGLRSMIVKGLDEPFNNLSDKKLTLELLDAFIKDVKRIEDKIKIPSLASLSLNSIFASNQQDRLDDYEMLKNLKVAEEGKWEFK